MLRLLGLHDSKYDAGPDMAPAVERLIQENPSQRPGPDSVRLGQGVWEVRSLQPSVCRVQNARGRAAGCLLATALKWSCTRRSFADQSAEHGSPPPCHLSV